MFELKLGNLDQAFAEVEKELTEVARGVTVAAWDGILHKTPQYTGALAASWTYCLNTARFVDRTDEAKASGGVQVDDYGKQFSTLYAGHRKAIDIARRASSGAERNFKLGDTVHITNGVQLGNDGDYAEAIEQGTLNLRLWNHPGQMISRTIDRMDSVYRNVKPSQAAKLRIKTVSAGTDRGNDE